MIRYVPINSGAPWRQADDAELLSFDWINRVAKFATVDGKHRLEISFPNPSIIIRILDDFALSTENAPAKHEGLIAHHFAYRVKGDPFLSLQSEAWRDHMGDVQHYRFMTADGCLDVIASGEPCFTLINV